MIETVRDLIKELANYNQDAKVSIGDNFDNRVSLGYGFSEGCTPKTCEYVCLHIMGKENIEKESEQTVKFSGEEYVKMYNETIVITDPCYIKDTSPTLKTSTIYGDWSCMVYPGKMGENKDPEKWDEEYLKVFNDYNLKEHTEEEKEKINNDWKWFKARWKVEHTLGEFTADAGEVGIFDWDMLTDEEQKWVKEHDQCAAIIENVNGRVGFKTITNENGEKSRHVICEGKTNFFTMQSGL